MLLIDGHSSHIDIDRDNKVLLYCLPLYSLHITQLLDVGLYGPLKKQLGRKQWPNMILIMLANLLQSTHLLKCLRRRG